MQPNYNHVLRYKVKSEEGLTPCSRLSQTPPWHSESPRSPWVLGRCSRQLRKSCAGESMVYSRAECVFILGHNSASKSFAAVREAFSNAYPGKEVPNKTIIHRLVTKFRDTGSVCLRQVVIERQSSWSCGRTDFKQCINCNNAIRLQEFNISVDFVVLYVKGCMCSS
jgi:hypothetical protein